MNESTVCVVLVIISVLLLVTLVMIGCDSVIYDVDIVVKGFVIPNEGVV